MDVVKLFGVVLVLSGVALLGGVVLGVRWRKVARQTAGRRPRIRRGALLARTVPLRQVTVPAFLAELPLAPGALVAPAPPRLTPPGRDPAARSGPGAAVDSVNAPGPAAPVRVPNAPPAARGLPGFPPGSGPRYANQPDRSPRPPVPRPPEPALPVPAGVPVPGAHAAGPPWDQPTWDQSTRDQQPTRDQWRAVQPTGEPAAPPRNDRSTDPARRPH